MQEERQSDLIMASALANALIELVERLDGNVGDGTTIADLRELASRAEAELEAAV